MRLKDKFVVADTVLLSHTEFDLHYRTGLQNQSPSIVGHHAWLGSRILIIESPIISAIKQVSFSLIPTS